MPKTNVKQRSDEWFELRKNKITGSRIGTLLAHNKYASVQDLIREMVREHYGAEREFNGNIATAWGEKHEPEAIKYFEDLTGFIVEEHGIVMHPTDSRIAYSPDGTFSDLGLDQLFEVKCPFSRKIPLKKADVNPAYIDQIQLGMEVMNINRASILFWTPDNKVVHSFNRDPEWWLRAQVKIDKFWDAYQNALQNPDEYLEPVKHEFPVIDTDEFTEAAFEYRKALLFQQEAKTRMDAARKNLIKAAGEESVDGAGLKVRKVVTKGRPQYKKFFDKHPDMLDEVEVGADSESFRILVD